MYTFMVVPNRYDLLASVMGVGVALAKSLVPLIRSDVSRGMPSLDTEVDVKNAEDVAVGKRIKCIYLRELVSVHSEKF